MPTGRMKGPLEHFQCSCIGCSAASAVHLQLLWRPALDAAVNKNPFLQALKREAETAALNARLKACSTLAYTSAVKLL